MTYNRFSDVLNLVINFKYVPILSVEQETIVQNVNLASKFWAYDWQLFSRLY